MKDERENELFIDDASIEKLEVDLKTLVNLKVRNDKIRLFVNSIMVPITGVLGAGIFCDLEKTSGVVLFSLFSALFAGVGIKNSFKYSNKLGKSKQLKELTENKNYDELIKETKDSKDIDIQTVNIVANLIKEDMEEKQENVDNFKNIYQDL